MLLRGCSALQRHIEHGGLFGMRGGDARTLNLKQL
jgi:hypothetical protein